MTELRTFVAPNRQVRALFAVLSVAVCAASSLAAQPFSLVEIGTYRHSEHFDVGAAEITSFDAATNRLFVVNSQNANLENGLESTVDVLDISNPSAIAKVGTLTVGGELTSVAVHNNVVAVSASNGDGVNGSLSLFRADTFAPLTGTFEIGATPDMVTFTPDGNKILIVQEGEPDYDAGLDPEGSIGIFDLTAFGGVSTTSVAGLSTGNMITASFGGFNSRKDDLRAAGVRIFGNPDDPNGVNVVSVAQDVEPEFLTVSPDSTRAFITLQENNAMAVLDLTQTDPALMITDIVPMGLKDHSLPGQGLDASDKDGMINIANWPVKGMYMPDAIAGFQVGGEFYLAIANEGDDRKDDVRIKDIKNDIDPTVFPDSSLWDNDKLGRLSVSSVEGDTDGDGKYEELHAFGARSFSIRTADGTLIYDSGDIMETEIAALFPDNFNCDSDDPTFDDRSGKMGPQPEGIAVGTIDDEILAFVAMADSGGIMVFDVTDPQNVAYQSYFCDRDWAAEALGDFSNSHTGPEGLLFIDAANSPTGNPLLVVSYEVSGTTGVYEIAQVPEPATLGLLALGGLGLLRRRK